MFRTLSSENCYQLPVATMLILENCTPIDVAMATSMSSYHHKERERERESYAVMRMSEREAAQSEFKTHPKWSGRMAVVQQNKTNVCQFYHHSPFVLIIKELLKRSFDIFEPEKATRIVYVWDPLVSFITNQY